MNRNTAHPNRPRAAAIACTVALCASAAMSLVPSAGAQSASSIRNEIDRTKAKIDRKESKAQSLSRTIGGLSTRINGIQGGITKLRGREAAVQAKLDVAVERLRRIQAEQRAAEKRLADLKAKLNRSRRTLAGRLVELYKSDRPDLITVVLHADGFARLIEHREFLARIGEQDRDIITAVQASKDETKALAGKLAKIESERQSVALEIKSRRDEIAAVRSRLEARRQAWANARSARRSALSELREQTKDLHDHVDSLEADMARVTGQLRPSGPIPAGPVRAGSGQFIWPMNGTITSPFCERRSWESCHPGIDIAAPTGTPIRAAGGGTVQIAGWVGGYGNYVCIAHGGGVSTCYGHQSAIRVSVGQRVSQGQVVGLCGSTGFSTGPHLHFEVRVNGAVTNPMNWL